VWQSLQTWLADWRNPALVLGLVALLYLARLPAERLIRAAFGFLARGLRLVDRWVLAGGTAAMAHHDALQADLAAEEAKGGYSTGTRFVFALILMAAVGIAAWLNLALLERPMAELVGDARSIMGVPLYRLAAMAIIVLEIAVGMVLLEALGGTAMFPQITLLEQQRRRLRIVMIVTLVLALFVLASIEAALALTRDEIARLDRELMGTLAGAAPSDTAQSVNQLTRYAQAAFGFVIPFALAFLGFAIELLVRTGRVVAQFAVGQVLLTGAFLVRLLRLLTDGLMALALALYDFLIFLPLYIERQVVHRLRKRAT
jgi:hypothetical protein